MAGAVGATRAIAYTSPPAPVPSRPYRPNVMSIVPALMLKLSLAPTVTLDEKLAQPRHAVPSNSEYAVTVLESVVDSTPMATAAVLSLTPA